MRIRLAVIPPDKLADVRSLIGTLRGAVDDGDLDMVDAVTGKLTNLTNGDRLRTLSEEEWLDWVAAVRRGTPSFRTDYLLPGNAFGRFFPGLVASSTVLQFPVEERDDSDV